jgi:hypothetical protein
MHRGAQQPARVGVQRAGHQRADRAFLHHLAGIHHRHTVGDLAGHAKVVRDEDHPHAHLLLQLLQQQQHLDLHRRIQRRGGFIRQQQLRPAGQRHGDHRPLPQPA